jgi:hypothetical protein
MQALPAFNRTLVGNISDWKDITATEDVFENEGRIIGVTGETIERGDERERMKDDECAKYILCRV